MRSQSPAESPFYTPERIYRMAEQARAWHRVSWHLDHIVGRLFHPDHLVLELGCGAGRYSYALAHRFPWIQFVAVDRVPDLVALAQASNSFPNLGFGVADAQRLAYFQGRAFNAVFGGHVLHHLPDLPRALRQIRRVLQPGGWYCGIEPNGYNLALQVAQRVQPRAPHERPLLPHRLAGLFRAAGFVDVQIRYFCPRCPRWPVLGRSRLLASCFIIRARLPGGDDAG